MRLPDLVRMSKISIKGKFASRYLQVQTSFKVQTIKKQVLQSYPMMQKYSTRGTTKERERTLLYDTMKW